MAVTPQIECVDDDAEPQQARDERSVPLDVASGVLAEAVLQQQHRTRVRRIPCVAPNARADVPGAVVDRGAQGARFACESPR